MNDLTDVDVPTPNSGDFLMYDGANWVTGEATNDTSGQNEDYIILGGGGEPIDFEVTVGPKSEWNQFYDYGSNLCFYINGKEAPVLMLPANRTFRFIQSDASNTGKPFSLFAEISPGQLNRYEGLGVSYAGTPGADGVTTITFTNFLEVSFSGKLQIADQTPRKLFYRHQDKDMTSNQYMGNTIMMVSHGIADNIGDIGGGDGGFPGGGGGFPGPVNNSNWGLSDVIQNFQDRIEQLEDQAGL